ncbi:hypothetical protein HYV50_03270 [Candidatus Pacearchaeota archaeon]|nr:hypothetical protein [Candidatus Pacearchaeota archaeon]
MEKKEVFFVIFMFIIIIFIISIFSYFVSAGITDWFTKITGKATQQAENVSVTLTGINPVTVNVFNGTLSGTGPTENTFTSLTFYVTVNDSDGVNDINDSSVQANFTNSGEPLRQNTSCSLVADIDSTSANYSCTIQMWYFDENAVWNIGASATDLGNTTRIHNTSMTFSYGQLQALKISPNSLTFTVNIGATNQTASNDPTLVNNTGNYNSPNLTVNAINLHGETTPAQFIGVGNFSIGNSTGGSPPAECALSTPTLQNATDRQLGNTILNRGNNTLNYGNETSGQEELYYCLRTVPSGISSQTYSTITGGSWFVKLT